MVKIDKILAYVQYFGMYNVDVE